MKIEKITKKLDVNVVSDVESQWPLDQGWADKCNTDCKHEWITASANLKRAGQPCRRRVSAAGNIFF
ncbi:MAG: hypothetical protein IJA32_00575 [Lachnospiraceae bacterium]|nr:hypothetical protein [Lachnospiraceae bacterium]